MPFGRLDVAYCQAQNHEPIQHRMSQKCPPSGIDCIEYFMIDAVLLFRCIDASVAKRN